MGVDLVSVSRLRDACYRRPQLLSRIFSPGEIADAGSGRHEWSRLASRWAAKEAVVKASGGLHGSTYRDIDVRRQRSGPPLVEVGGALGKWLDESGYRVTLSLSHEREYAVAMVVLECAGE